MCFIVMFVTAVCVLFLIKLRWPKKNNFYKHENICAEEVSEDLSRRHFFPFDKTFFKVPAHKIFVIILPCII